MIKVVRGLAPEGFQKRASQWRKGFAKARRGDPALSAGRFWSRVRREIQPDGVELCRRFHNKCVFCESRMKHVSNPHIEHYRPKGRKEFERLMFDWDNWLLSCGRCNEKKWTHFPECNGQPCLLNPATEDPAPHLDFLGAIVIGLSQRGDETIRLVALDRSPLLYERAAWLLHVNTLLLLACRADKEEIRKETREHLIWTMQEDAPYSAMTKAYLAAKAPRLAHPDSPHSQVDGTDRMNGIESLVKRYSADIKNLQ